MRRSNYKKLQYKLFARYATSVCVARTTMMDPFSVAAGCAGLASLAIQISKLTYQYISAVKNSSLDASNFIRELSALRNVLTDLENNIICNNDVAEAFESRSSSVLSQLGRPQNNGHAGQTPSLSVIQLCEEDLKVILAKFEKNAAKSSLSRAMTRLKWPFDEPQTTKYVDMLHRHRSIFESSVAIDSLALGALTLKEVKSARIEMNHAHQRNLSKEIGDWLSPLKFEDKQANVLSTRHPGTGQWLLDLEDFAIWEKASSSIDRTILFSIIVDHLTMMQQRIDVSVAFAYCDYTDQANQTPAKLIGSIARQLVEQDDSLHSDLEGLCRKSNNGRIPSKLSDHLDLIKKALDSRRQTFILIDALDESDNVQQKHRKELLKAFAELMKLPINMFVTSRTYPEDIARFFKDSKRVELSANESDVRSYIEAAFESNTMLQASFENDLPFKERVVSSMISKSRGQFLLPALHINRLSEQICKKEIAEALDDLATTLEESYKQTWERIERQSQPRRDLAFRVLIWTAFTKSPLQIDELRLALAIEPDRDVDKGYVRNTEVLVDVCFGLVRVQEEEDSIRPIHFTLQEYLTKRDGFYASAHFVIAQGCINFLLMPLHVRIQLIDLILVDTHPCLPVIDLSRTEFAFQYYAINNWGLHARDGSEVRLFELIGKLFSIERCRFETSSALATGPGYLKIPDSEYEFSEVIHIAAFFGMEKTLKCLVANDRSMLNALDHNKRTALHWAIENRQLPVVTFLLDQDDIEVNTFDISGESPLSLAIRTHQKGIVRKLLAMPCNKGPDRSRR
ncbi:MAG: hypothetical protein M1814_004546 [Vezdaea aestivalis]|nr:MAG: hypothetical protein M1814_004546 [Vezdaea aestivalis]